jgi:hypothetical protein
VTTSVPDSGTHLQIRFYELLYCFALKYGPEKCNDTTVITEAKIPVPKIKYYKCPDETYPK